MKYRRVMIAAPGSGNGKTTVTCALLQALMDQGYQTVSFKCGPDYIDPMFHEKVVGVPSRNLDTFFTDAEQTRRLFLENAPEDGLSVMEGVMGLYDGLGGVREEGSSYHLAEVTGTPVVLVADVKGMGRSVIPLLAGFLSYDRAHLIKGVILNRMSAGYYETIKPLVEEELGLTVLGFLPEKKQLRLESRHLGLVMPDELSGVREKIKTLAKEFVKTVSLGEVLEIMRNAGKAEAVGSPRILGSRKEETARSPEKSGSRKAEAAMNAGKTEESAARTPRPVVAVARDEAFCFYYADNLGILEECGAAIQYFSPLHDTGLPAPCHALLFGGGYPELYADRLSANHAMRTAVRQAIAKGMPVVAECGGFIYLHSVMVDQDGKNYDMVGAILGKCFYTGSLVRFGYITMREKTSNFLPEGETIKGHEFHYYDSTHNGEDVLAAKPMTGREYPCIMEGENYWLGFPHLYYPSNPEFARRFVGKAVEYQRGAL